MPNWKEPAIWKVYLMGRWFDNDWRALAVFLGVSESTVLGWLAGRYKPNSAALRLMYVLESLEGHGLHAVLVDEAVKVRTDRGHR